MRKFRCPFCEFEHTFSPKGKSKYKKRVVGFTCPKCGKKATEKDLRKVKGKGPKPPGERRKRKKSVDKQPHIVPVINPTPRIAEPDYTEWRRKDQNYRPPFERVSPAANRHWKPQPTDRTLGSAVLLMSDIDPEDMANVIEIETEPVEEMKKETKVEEIESATEAMEEARKKLQGVVINLSNIEKKMTTKLDASTEKLERSISIISTLLAHIDNLTEEAAKKKLSAR